MSELQLFAAVWITVFLLGMKITQAVRDHIHEKDVTKELEEERRVSEEKRREAEARERAADAEKRAAELEKIAAETKLELANKIAAMNEEQLAAYNRTLDHAMRQFYTPPRYMCRSGCRATDYSRNL